MANTLEYYRQLVYSKYVSERAAAGLPYDDPASWSIFSIKRMFTNIVASIAFFLDSLFDILRFDTLDALAQKKPHTPRWYRNQALLFQYGFPLDTTGESFDNTGYSPEEVEDSLIVDYAAVVEQEDVSGRIYLRMKLAHDNGLDLEPLLAIELDAFKVWFNSTQKDGGVKMQIDSLPADSLSEKWTIYYDPLILSSTGARLDGSAPTPVQDAIRGYLKALPFNGVFVPAYHVDAVQAVEGVVIPELVSCTAKYGNLNYSAVMTKYVPDSGYLRFDSDEDLEVLFKPQPALK